MGYRLNHDLAGIRYLLDAKPHFTKWAAEHKLKESTVSKLIEEDLNDLETLSIVDLQSLTSLNLTIGQRALLQTAVAGLKSKIFGAFC